MGWRGAAVLLMLAVAAVAQEATPATSAALPAFDVVSVQAFKPTGPWHRLPQYDPERMYMEGMYPVELIREAYQVNGNQIVGLERAMPRSMTKQGPGGGIYRVIGTTDKPTSVAQMRLMLRRVLAERFQLVVKDTTQMQPVYDLAVAPSGPKLRVSKSDNDCSHGFITSEKYASFHLPRDSRLVYWGCTISDLVKRLNVGPAGGIPNNLPVIDKTGLAGHYAIVLWQATGGSVPDPDIPNAIRFVHMEPVQEALKLELGLELVRSTGPYREIIVEHIAEPSPN